MDAVRLKEGGSYVVLGSDYPHAFKECDTAGQILSSSTFFHSKGAMMLGHIREIEMEYIRVCMQKGLCIYFMLVESNRELHQLPVL